ncbi:hypothetical protein SARC_05744 [Sphaeroforma arctica JP610]|uniref:Uncharacterized protein n=1 Tax=Sphaeroforma arctica JP610 TaxID=667725 RepID=A0A0L0FYM8_9EUKA|nr:hypothetical protein SARC_05744 [Sphaeroforma arctica JP610]KNC81952.1 hypothetical protein SARC_05744 [Sphaeroforma arctica JP610]|eukprot:XP_014155854.1 hypothetical protein SARC_05744 [Sphaeroforma arctica JP610]
MDSIKSCTHMQMCLHLTQGRQHRKHTLPRLTGGGGRNNQHVWECVKWDDDEGTAAHRATSAYTTTRTRPESMDSPIPTPATKHTPGSETGEVAIESEVEMQNGTFLLGMSTGEILQMDSDTGEHIVCQYAHKHTRTVFNIVSVGSCIGSRAVSSANGCERAIGMDPHSSADTTTRVGVDYGEAILDGLKCTSKYAYLLASFGQDRAIVVWGARRTPRHSIRNGSSVPQVSQPPKSANLSGQPSSYADTQTHALIHTYTETQMSISPSASTNAVENKHDTATAVLRKGLCNIPTFGGHAYVVTPSVLDVGKVAIAAGDGALRIWSAFGTARAPNTVPQIAQPVTKSKKGKRKNNKSKARANMVRPVAPTHEYECEIFWKGLQTKITALVWHPSKEQDLVYATEEGHVGVYDLGAHRYKQFAGYHKGSVFRVVIPPKATCAHVETPSSEQAHATHGRGGGLETEAESTHLASVGVSEMNQIAKRDSSSKNACGKIFDGHSHFVWSVGADGVVFAHSLSDPTAKPVTVDLGALLLDRSSLKATALAHSDGVAQRLQASSQTDLRTHGVKDTTSGLQLKLGVEPSLRPGNAKSKGIPVGDGKTTEICFSADGCYLAVGRSNGLVQLDLSVLLDVYWEVLRTQLLVE